VQKELGHDPLANLAGIKPGAVPQIFAAAGKDSQQELGWFAFGQLVAIYGDMRANVDELNDPHSRPFVTGLKAVADTGDYAHNKPERKRMLELAYVNETHFSGKAVEAYVHWHDQALRTAATDKHRPWLALHYEALALHSFTDLFAVGHMMVDRERTMSLLSVAEKTEAKATAELKSGVRHALEGGLEFFRFYSEEAKAKLLFGFFANLSHNGFNFHGAEVTDLRGRSWQAFGDHRFRVTQNGREITAAQRESIRQGVAESVAQVLRALNGKPPPIPSRRYEALAHLPVHFKHAATCVALSKEGLTTVRALLKQNFGLLTEGGLDPGLLKTQPIPDGDVPYVAAVRQHCDAACR
jgi:hypothetical protein